MLQYLFGGRGKQSPKERTEEDQKTSPAAPVAEGKPAPPPVSATKVPEQPVAPPVPAPVVSGQPVVSPVSALVSEKAAVAVAQAHKARDVSLYKNLLAGLYDGILIFDSKGTVIGSNQRAAQFFGYTEDDLWGMQCETLVIGVNSKVLYKLHSHAEAGRFTVVNGTCKRKDASTFPAEIAISRIRLLNEGDLIFSIRNIERREKAREQREISEEAIRCAGAGIVVCSIEGGIEFVNPAFLKLMNIEDEQEVLKHMIGDFCSSYEVVNAMMHAPSSQGLWLGPLELVTPKGAKRDVMVTAALSQTRRSGGRRLVLTMTPMPKALV